VFSRYILLIPPAIIPTTSPHMSTTAHTKPCTQLLDVPVAVLTVILGHVPLTDRLGVCTRVCRSFHAAAVAATSSLGIMSMSSQAQCDQLEEWLQRHGGSISAMEVQVQVDFQHVVSLASLPCPLLRDLNLSVVALQPGVFSTCTGLTRLLLESCIVEDSPQATSGADSNPLMQLSVLSSLQHLNLGRVFARGSATSVTGALLEIPSSLLSQLVQLTYLKLGLCQVQSDAALQHLSALSALQHLDLNLRMRSWGLQPLTAAVLTGLQHLQQLTALHLWAVPWAINLHSLPAVTMLTALRVLQLQSTSVNPAVLAGFSQLQWLGLICHDPWSAQGCARVLAAVGQQAQLTRLQLCAHSSSRAPSAAAYSALTASSCLQLLSLASCQLPVGAWQHMFPPKKCLPELRALWWQSEDNGAERTLLSPADMQAMVSCCPALSDLGLGSQLAVSTAAPLQQLTGLTHLSISASFQDNAPSIARLTGLQRLSLNAQQAGDQVTASGLLQLTVLQQLRDMIVTGAACDPGLAWSQENPGRVKIASKVRLVGCCSLRWFHGFLNCSASKVV